MASNKKNRQLKAKALEHQLSLTAINKVPITCGLFLGVVLVYVYVFLPLGGYAKKLMPWGLGTTVPADSIHAVKVAKKSRPWDTEITSGTLV